MFRTIVVGIDASETARKALDTALEIARLAGASLHVVTAYDEGLIAGGDPLARMAMADLGPALRKAAEDLVDEAERAAEIALAKHALPGDPAGVIIEVAEKVDADLVVVGNKGMTGAKRFLLGSVPNRVAHHAGRTVMIVHTT